MRRDRRARRARGTSATTWRFVAAQAALLDLVVVVGAVATWPIYRSSAFVVLVAVALAAGHAVAWAGLRWRWTGWWVALAAIGAYLALGLPLAAPATLTSPPDALRGLVGVLSAPATGWRDLLTLELPLGSYQATLAPALVVFLGTTVLSLSLAWRSPRLWPLAAPVALLPTLFGVAFGSTAPATPLSVGPLRLSPEAVVGAAALLSALAAIVWRTGHERRRAVAAATAASGVRATGRPARSVVGRVGAASAMIVVASLAGAIAAPWALADHSRDVLRSGVDPRLELAAEISPLAQYRGWFDDDRFGQTLFRVDAPAGIDRVRLATLPFYDGQVARVVDPAAGAGDARTAFVRVPSALPAPSGLTTGTAEFVVDAYRGVWLPTVGETTSIDFAGTDAAALADGFFHNAATAGSVQLAEPGLSAGTSYRQHSAYDPRPASAASLVPARSGPALEDALVPESLREWVDGQEVAAGGEGLVALIERLRARGFLSHALMVDPAEPPAWTEELGDYTFQPSRAGHSTDRVDDLFTDLLERQSEVGGDEDADLVAGVGDDEQFAVAGMMIADRLGFDARVVVGARLDSEDASLPTCDAGACTAGDVAAWIEVRGTGADWVALDVTPQHELFPSPDTEQRRDPQIPTEVRREQAESVLPAESNPADGADRADDDSAAADDLTALWAAVRIGGASLLALLVLVGPFVLVLVLKALRRRGRRSAPDTIDRFTGGWQEWVDIAVDHGHAAPRSQTRQELARQYGDGSGAGVQLATWADRSVFDAVPPTDAESERFWTIVDAERTRFAGEVGWWARLRARVSLRSLLPRTRARTRSRRQRGGHEGR